MYDSPTQVQIPLRISNNLNERLTRISNYTRIPKSELGRIAIGSLLTEIESRGMSSVLESFEAKV